jgi:hypothetical protein
MVILGVATGIFSILYILALFLGIMAGVQEYDHKDFLELREVVFDMPVKRIFFTFAAGVYAGHWLFGCTASNKSKNDEIRSKLEKLDELEEENFKLKQEVNELAAELYLLTDKGA